MTLFRKPWMLAFALFAAVALFAVACGGDDDDDDDGGGTTPQATATKAAGAGGASALQAQLDKIKGDTTGVTDKEVVFGANAPKTGTLAVYNDINVGWQAYFADVNKKGGIAGRQIKFVIEDDGYNPSNTVNVMKKLVEQDQVFAMFNPLGTPTVSAVIDYLKAQGVPALFIASGASKWAKLGPNVIGLQPDYINEGDVLGKYMAANYKGKKYGILLQNDDFGKDGRDGIKKGVGSDLTLVGEETYEANAADITSQALKLVNAGADVIGIYSTPTQFAAALKNLKSQGKNVVWVSSSVTASSTTAKLAEGAMDGVFTSGWQPDLSEAATNPEVKKAIDFFIAQGIAKEQINNFHLFAWIAAQHLERLLTITGKNLNRESIIFAMENMAFQGDWTCSICLKPTIITAADHKPVEAQFMQRWSQSENAFKRVGDVIDAETTKK
ncbi:MAG: ABC transporter substrate-binding protein [Tepidiformaceae bacterium]